MDILLVEGAVTAATAIASGLGGRVLWVRSRNHHQEGAIEAQTAADAAYLAFSTPLASSTLTVETLLSQLGPQDSAAFRKQADKVLAAAETLGSDYAAFAYQEDGNNPHSRHKRHVYIRLTREYAEYARKLLKRRNDLEALAAQCAQFQKQIENLPDTRAVAERVMAEARTALAARAEEGWVVVSFQSDLEAADDLLQRAIGSMTACELITARDEVAEARKQAATVANAVQRLPQRQHDLLRQAAIFERQRIALLRDLERAEAGLRAVQGIYAETAYSTEAHDLESSRLLHTQLESLIGQVHECAQPHADAWAEADAYVSQVTGMVEKITADCKELMGLRTELDNQMGRLLEDATKLRGTITEVTLKSRNRDGNQKKIRRALKRVDGEVVTLIRTLDEPLPDPDRLGTRLNELDDLVARLKRASKEMDEEEWDDDDDDDEEGIFRVIVAGAAAAIGIDLMID